MPQLPTSVVLEYLILDAPSDRVNLDWLIERLGSRSFGFVLLLLGICALLPVASPIAGLLLTIPAFQMIWAQAAPVFPQRVIPLTLCSLVQISSPGRSCLCVVTKGYERGNSRRWRYYSSFDAYGSIATLTDFRTVTPRCCTGTILIPSLLPAKIGGEWEPATSYRDTSGL
jgi:hypothetical protein